MTSQTHSLQSNHKRTPVDDYHTSTSRIQQDTENIILEHGISDGGVSIDHLSIPSRDRSVKTLIQSQPCRRIPIYSFWLGT